MTTKTTAPKTIARNATRKIAAMKAALRSVRKSLSIYVTLQEPQFRDGIPDARARGALRAAWRELDRLIRESETAS